MAGVGFKIRQNPLSTPSDTSTKTLLMVKAAANHAVLISEFAISFNGTSNTAAPLKVEILRLTTDGTSPSNSGTTIVKDPDSSAETLQTAVYDTWGTDDATGGSVLRTFYVHPQTGYDWQARYRGEIRIPGGGRVGVRVTGNGASISASVEMAGEE